MARAGSRVHLLVEVAALLGRALEADALLLLGLQVGLLVLLAVVDLVAKFLVSVVHAAQLGLDPVEERLAPVVAHLRLELGEHAESLPDVLLVLVR